MLKLIKYIFQMVVFLAILAWIIEGGFNGYALFTTLIWWEKLGLILSSSAVVFGLDAVLGNE